MIAIMVHHMTKRQLVGITPADTVPDDIEMELAAMDAVGTAIGELRDADARLRILRWAMERFDPYFVKTPKNSLMPQAARADLDDVSVDNLDGLFDNDAPVVKMGPRPVENRDRLFENDALVVKIGPRSVDDLDGLFESDAPVVKIGPRSVDNLDGLFESDAPVVKIGPRSVENLDGLFEIDAPVVKIGPRSMENIDEQFELDAPVVNTGPQSGRSQPGLDSLFRDFVAEFQQLASEIQGA